MYFRCSVGCDVYTDQCPVRGDANGEWQAASVEFD